MSDAVIHFESWAERTRTAEHTVARRVRMAVRRDRVNAQRLEIGFKSVMAGEQPQTHW